MSESVANAVKYVIAESVVQGKCPLEFSRLMETFQNTDEYNEFAASMATGDSDIVHKSVSKPGPVLIALHALCRKFYRETGTRLQLSSDAQHGSFWFLPDALMVVPEVQALIEKNPEFVKPMLLG